MTLGTLTRPLLGLGLALTVAGCAAADKNAAATSTPSSTTPSHSAGGVSGAGTAMAGMNAGPQNVPGAGTPIPTRTIASGVWKEMRIEAQERTAVPFYVDNGSSYSEVKPTRRTSFHLMVMLTDRQTGVALPYATVWAEVLKGSRIVFNERQWQMLSKYMGPHYGNNVTLPGPGNYTLKLLISAPAAAMHVEYGNMWTGTHTVTSTFTWK